MDNINTSLEKQPKKHLQLKKMLINTVVGTIICGVAVAVIAILSNGLDETALKIEGTIALIGFYLVISINNFTCAEKKQLSMYIAVTICLIFNLLFVLTLIAIIWGIFTTTPTITKLLTFLGQIALASFLTSNVLSIKNTSKAVKILKTIAIICSAYICLTNIILSQIGTSNIDNRVVGLITLAYLTFLITAIPAYIISKNTDNKQSADNSTQTQKSEAELRAEIEEKVRREMLEKEIRTKLESDQPSPSKQDSAPSESTPTSSQSPSQ